MKCVFEFYTSMLLRVDIKKKKTLFLISYYERSDAVYTDNSQMYLLF